MSTPKGYLEYIRGCIQDGEGQIHSMGGRAISKSEVSRELRLLLVY